MRHGCRRTEFSAQHVGFTTTRYRGGQARMVHVIRRNLSDRRTGSEVLPTRRTPYFPRRDAPGLLGTRGAFETRCAYERSASKRFRTFDVLDVRSNGSQNAMYYRGIAGYDLTRTRGIISVVPRRTGQLSRRHGTCPVQGRN